MYTFVSNKLLVDNSGKYYDKISKKAKLIYRVHLIYDLKYEFNEQNLRLQYEFWKKNLAVVLDLYALEIQSKEGFSNLMKVIASHKDSQVRRRLIGFMKILIYFQK